jgi:hypothetical protein
MNNYVWIRENGKNYNEHRKIMEDYLGHKLKYDEVVHHIDENKSNNKIENLRLMTRSEHTKLHTKPEAIVTLNCYICGKEYLYPKRYYTRGLKKGQKFMCSRKCVGLYSKKHLPHPKSEYCIASVKKGLNERLKNCEIARKYNIHRITVSKIKKRLNLK